jgi:hypothetical protein
MADKPTIFWDPDLSVEDALNRQISEAEEYYKATGEIMTRTEIVAWATLRCTAPQSEIEAAYEARLRGNG